VILPSDVTINQDATIQRFEFTFELAWKLMKTILEEEGIKVVSPKNVIRPDFCKMSTVKNIGLC